MSPSSHTFLNRTFRAFTYRDFRLMWLGAFTSSTGTWMQMVAQAWVVLNLTDSPFYLGLTSFAGEFPIVLFTLLGGVVADRLDRRRLLLTSQYTQMSTAFVLALLIFTGHVALWHILICASINGLAQSFGGPAYQALIPSLVQREDLHNAIALNSIQFNLARVVGPLLAGWAFIQFGAAACFALNGLSFVAVIVSLYVIHSPFSPSGERQTIFREMIEGFLFLKERGSIWQLTLLGFVSTFLGIPLLTLLPVFARDVFHLSAGGYSAMMAFSGAGAVLGALAYASLGHIQRKGLVALLVQATFGILLLAFSVSRTLWFACAVLLMAGSCLIAVFASITSLVQSQTGEEVRGRVMSVFMLAFRGGMPLGNLTAGWMAQVFSPQVTLGVNGALLAGIAGSFLLRRSSLKRL